MTFSSSPDLGTGGGYSPETVLALKEARLQAEYQARRSSQLKMLIVGACVVGLIVVAGIIGLLSLNSAVAQLHTNLGSDHTCSLAIDKLLLQGIRTSSLPTSCP
jgi:hypothetical protein